MTRREQGQHRMQDNKSVKNERCHKQNVKEQTIAIDHQCINDDLVTTACCNLSQWTIPNIQLQTLTIVPVLPLAMGVLAC